LAARLKVLRVGEMTVAVDGTKILANASKHGAVSHGHAVEQMKLAGEQIEELLAKAEDADSTPLRDGLSVPEEIKRREARIARLKQAVEVMEERARERVAQEQAEHEAKLAARRAKEEATGRKAGGREPQAPKEGPQDKDQYNFTDPESRIMKAGGGFQQCYNAQAAVEVESMLVVGQRVTDAPNDKEQLRPTLAAVSPVAGTVDKVLVDSGYYGEAAVLTVEDGGKGPAVYAATGRQRHGRSVAELEKRDDPPAPPPGATLAEVMEHRLRTMEGKALYGLRKQTVEPAFGIIKEVMGFRRFLLRGRDKVNLEWTLVTTAYNLKRLFGAGARLRGTRDGHRQGPARPRSASLRPAGSLMPRPRAFRRSGRPPEPVPRAQRAPHRCAFDSLDSSPTGC
jgi:hypothetical protein